MKIGTNFKKRIKAFFGVFLIAVGLLSTVNAQVVTGVDTLKKVSGVWEYYDFTSSKSFTIADTATYTPDFWGSSNEGVNFGKEFSSIIPSKRLYLLGIGNIDTVKTVPMWTDTAPWVDTSWDFTNGTQGQPVSTDQLWVVYTSEGLYAVMQIDELPAGNFGDSFVFKYKYMSEGGTTLEETNLNGSGQLSGSATSTSGSGFDFSRQEIGDNNDAGDYQLDFAFVNNEGVNFGNESSTSLVGTGRRFILLGNGNIDSLKSVPVRMDQAPWVDVSYDFSNGTQGQPISVGELWGVYTREGHYAAIEITALPGGNFGSSFDFKYKYQPDGTRFFEGSVIEPELVLSIAIESGDNQSVLPETVASEFLKVLITDENANLISGEIVNFSIASEPVDATISGSVAATGTSNEAGLAQAFMKTGNAPGIYKIRAELASDTSKFVIFTTTAEDTTTASGDLIVGSSTSTSGTGFDFSRQETGDNNDAGDYQLDFAFVNNEGVNFGNESSSSLSGTGRRFLRIGTGDISSVSSIQERTDATPWVTVSYDFSDGTGGLPISVGELWGVYTREGHYAVMEITALPGGNFGSSFDFKYKYQPNGTNTFGDVEPIIADTLVIVSGEGQTAEPNSTLQSPFEVAVLDKDGNGVVNVPVSFEITSIPSGSIGAMLNDSVVVTNGSGSARTVFTLGSLSGSYEITATVKDLGSVTFNTTAMIEEIFPPEPVTMLEVRDGFRPNSLIPEWTQSESDNFLLYRVYMSTEGGEFMLVDSTRVGAGFIQDTSRVIGDLTALQEYSFAVTVVNVDYQESELSNSLSSFPKPTPEVPLNVVAVAGDGAVQLTWNANDSTYFDFYYVYSGIDGQTISPNDTLYSANDTSLVISDLKNDQAYQFYVIAVNRFGVESSFPEKVTAVPTSSLQEEETDLPNLINGVSSWADVDNDGDLDLVMTGQIDEETDPVTFLFLNDGEGNFTDSNNTIIGVINSSTYWYDIDQNGYVDLILSGESSTGPITKVYLNEEGTLMDSGFTFPGLGDGLVAPGDYDNDGDLDFLIAGDAGSGPQTLLIQNGGNGTFIPVEFPFIGFTKASAAWGDYNKDGWLDFIISGEVESGDIVTILYKNNGKGSFLVGESSITGVINGTLAFTDLDLDNDLDILVTGFTNQEQSATFTGLYRNTGLDFDLFYSATNPPSKAIADAKNSIRAVIGDYDNDGDPDVLINSKADASILKNNRTSVSEEILDLGIEGSVTWADYDGDGDLDIIATGSGADGASSKILANTTLIRNTAPSTPINLMAEVVMDTVKLSWNVSSDAQTPSSSLTYNLRIGSSEGASDILSSNADLGTGRLRIQANGNASYNNEFVLRDLPNGTYFWQVQAVDNSFLGSKFSVESEFIISNSTVSNEEVLAGPTELRLQQNYPNPFNPSTNIEYSVPENGAVTLQVFDITGRLVSSLVNERKAVGEYSARFDARNLASGLYIYRLQVGNNVITKKMTLIK